ncbi:U-box domain-containing protein 35-like [Neltuma alba]|uniref:U-box domain-containing protein 35-like n=1 Tax=Neltuma alba TaxID=207710 RepID=UPI0010A367A5|nr:U-box domain-containing protein 35-like [Prosopis alba]
MSSKETLSDDESEISSNCTSFSSFRGFKRNQQVFDDDDVSLETNNERATREVEEEQEEEGYLELDLDSDSDSDSLFGTGKNPKEEGLDTIREEDCESSVFSLDFRSWREDVVHVCVGKHGDKSSLEALSWTLKHWITPFTTLRLLHVFPLVRLIPSPMGKLPRSHVNKSHINLYLDQHKCNRKRLLQRFIDLCLASQVKVETMLTEGDNAAESIVDVINNIGVQKLVLGITKSNLRKSGSRRRKAMAVEVVKKAPENCDVKIICEGKDVIYDLVGAASPRSSECDTPLSGSSREEDESRGGVPFKKMPGPRISSASG